VDLFDKVDDYLFFNQNIGGSIYNYRTYYNGETGEIGRYYPIMKVLFMNLFIMKIIYMPY